MFSGGAPDTSIHDQYDSICSIQLTGARFFSEAQIASFLSNYIGTVSALSVTSSQQYIEIQIQIQTEIQILFSPNYAGTLSALSVTSSNLVLGKTDPLHCYTG